jgi:pimeloyl-ACP methyl ester carboxylesterase
VNDSAGNAADTVSRTVNIEDVVAPLTIATQKETYIPGDTVTVTIKGTLSGDQDWAGVYPVNASNDWKNVIAWNRVHTGDNVLNKDMKEMPAGAYEVRLFFHNATENHEAKGAFTVKNNISYEKQGPYTPKRYPDGNALTEDNYVVYYPQDPETQEDAITEDMPVVLFLEGGGSGPHIDDYRGIMQYLASRGYFVIGGETGEGYDIRNYVHIFEKALNVAKEKHGLRVNKLAVMGHSQGGGQAFYTMRYFQDPLHGGYGGDASLVLSIDGWFSFDMNRSDLRTLKGDVAFLQMNGLEGTGTDPRVHLTIWNLADQTKRTFLTLPENNHGYVAGTFETLLNEKKDLIHLVGALCDDTFQQSDQGYDSIDQNYKTTHDEIRDHLKPKDNYSADCAGEKYNAKSEIERYDIDYCGLGAELVARTVDRGLPNIAKETNPTFDTLASYENAQKHHFIADADESHTQDGSGSVELIAHHYENALASKTFPVKKGKKYLLSGYVKMTNVPHGQNVTISLWPRSVTGWSEVSWNVSKADEWQEILMPFIPVADGDAQWAIFTATRAFSTTYTQEPKHQIYHPDAVKVDGSNLDRSSHVFFDDFKVVEMHEEITPREPVNTDKKVFESDFVRIDKLGNMYVKKEGEWSAIIPKLISRGNPGSEDDPESIEHFKKQLRAYVEHGFNGVIAMYDVGQVKKALEAGLEYYVGMGARSNTQPDGSEGRYSSLAADAVNRLKEKLEYIYKIDKPYTQLFYYLDNENEKVQEYAFKEKWAKFIDDNDKDTHGHRARPIFYLNGTFGISRLYGKNLMDMTGAYVGLGGTGSPKTGAPKPTIGVMDVTQGHDVPSNVIQLQVYLDDKFIPSLWFGIIQGGKVISVWRDDDGNGSSIDKPKPFQSYAWATDIKKVFAEVDSMAAIIREPHWTKWKVHVSGSEYVNIGTREHNGTGYVILSNHSDKDERVTLHFDGIHPSSVKDHLGQAGQYDIVDDKVTVTLGHGNRGYLVLKLVD